MAAPWCGGEGTWLPHGVVGGERGSPVAWKEGAWLPHSVGGWHVALPRRGGRGCGSPVAWEEGTWLPHGWQEGAWLSFGVAGRGRGSPAAWPEGTWLLRRRGGRAHGCRLAGVSCRPPSMSGAHMSCVLVPHPV